MSGMPTKMGATKDFLIAAPLPAQTETYTVISHGFVIDKALETLKNKGFEVRKEFYRCNQGASVAQGVYHLNFSQDKDLGMMFAWSNSYDKSMRFRCTIGGYEYQSNNMLISNNISTWGRKHTGTADQETALTIEGQIEAAEDYFKQLVHDKNAMKEIVLTEAKRAELMGKVFFVNELLTTEQLSLVKQQFKKPNFTYGVGTDTVWFMYNCILLALQRSHPSTWMEQQRLMHWFMTSEFDIMPLSFTAAEKEILAGAALVDHDLPKGVQLRLFDEKVVEVESIPAAEPVVSDPIAPEVIDEIYEEAKEVHGEVLERLDGVSKPEELTTPFTSDGNPGIDGTSFTLTVHKSDFPEPSIEIIDNLTVSSSEVDVPTITDMIDLNKVIVIPCPEMDVSQCVDPAHLINEISMEISPEVEAVIELKTVVEEEVTQAAGVPVQEEPMVDDMSWPCAKCGEFQGPEAVYYPGQLCEKCYEPK